MSICIMPELEPEPSLTGLDLTEKDDLLTALDAMVRIREFEDRAGEVFLDGELPGIVHLSIGQEAVPVGTCAALAEDDYIVSTHRGHHHAVANGLDTEKMMAELYGKTDGYNDGKGGSMHIADEEAGFLGGNGIVGASPVLATGAALTASYKDEDRVGVAFMGDGAVAQGQGFEAMNIAAIWDLPAIYVIENNEFGEATPAKDQHNVENLSETAKAFDISGVTVDGMDVTEVYEAVKEAREHAEAGNGPSIIEARTYRYRSHSAGRPQPYRTEDEIEEVRKTRDPIETVKRRLQDAGVLTDAEFEEMEERAADEIADAVEFGRNGTFPETEEAYTDMNEDQAPEIEYFREKMER